MQYNTRLSWSVIVNPHAGNGKSGKKWPMIRQYLDQHLILQDVFFTREPGDASTIARQLASEGKKYIIGVGGDGTNFEIINGIFSQSITASTDIIYALLPVGTGNDWIRHHGIPKQLGPWVAMVQQAKTIRQDVGYVDCHGMPRKFFMNVCGMAYDAFVVKYLQPWRRWIQHPLIYILGILRCLYLYQLPLARIQLDNDAPITTRTYTINAGICRFSGGGLQIVPHAIATDGQLAVTIAPELSKLEVLRNTPRFYSGTLHQHPKIIARQVHQLRVLPAANEEIWVEADGELLGKAPVNIGILPAALNIVVP